MNKNAHTFMRKAIVMVLAVTLLPHLSFSQARRNVFTEDVDRFWMAYDSITSTNDNVQQMEFINRLYIDKASEGLRAFLKNKEAPGQRWVGLINSDRAFWDSIRPKTVSAKAQVKAIDKHLNTLRFLYPVLKDAASYFIIGFNQQGGTVRNNLSIIGTEVIASQSKFNPADLQQICLHEFVHTQQAKPDFRNINVLTSSIREGACDFISELVLKQNLSTPYIEYGRRNEVDIWKVFQQDMLTTANDLWVSTGDNPLLPTNDLGYFVGYAICKSYYQSSKDKTQAVKDIIDLDYTKQDAVLAFLQKSNYGKRMEAKGYIPSTPLPREGYVSKPSRVVFTFPASNKLVVVDENGSNQSHNPKTMGEIISVSVAGDFNNWDFTHPDFQLAKDKTGRFSLSVDKERLGTAGQTVKFKFVINGKYWVLPSFAISNRVTDSEGTANLFVQL